MREQMAAETGDAKARVARGGWHRSDAWRRSPGPATPASASEGRSPEISPPDAAQSCRQRPL